MNINIITVGKINQNYINAGIKEFEKRLKGYCTLKIIEVADLPAPENLSQKELEDVKIKEGEEILKHLKNTDYNVALDLSGRDLSSEKMAESIEDIMIDGIYPNINYIIGGSNGLSKEVLQKANFKLSFGAKTYPHQLMRLILLEQIYRSFRIIHNHPYHK